MRSKSFERVLPKDHSFTS